MAWGSAQGHRDRCARHEVFCWIRKDNLCYREDFCHPSMGHGWSVLRTTPAHNVLSAGGASWSLISRGKNAARPEQSAPGSNRLAGQAWTLSVSSEGLTTAQSGVPPHPPSGP